jgi:hypothetical protein
MTQDIREIPEIRSSDLNIPITEERIFTKVNSRQSPKDFKRAMFSIRDFVTAGINILGAIDALETALARAASDADTIVITDNEKELLCFGIVDARFVLSAHGQEPPKVLSLLALRIANSFEVPRAKASAVLAEFRSAEALAEADLIDPPIALAA